MSLVLLAQGFTPATLQVDGFIHITAEVFKLTCDIPIGGVFHLNLTQVCAVIIQILKNILNNCRGFDSPVSHVNMSLTKTPPICTGRGTNAVWMLSSPRLPQHFTLLLLSSSPQCWSWSRSQPRRGKCIQFQHTVKGTQVTPGPPSAL